MQAKVLPTPMHGDHLRFSLVVSIAVLLSFFLLHRSEKVIHKIFLTIIITWLVAYLHLLAARTGLICCYIIMGSVLIGFVLRKKSLVLSLSLLMLLIALPLLAFKTLPTFKARFLYLRYDLTQVYYGHYTAGTTDGGRVLSVKGGLDILRQHPLGIGLGDIRQKMDAWYDAAVPQMIESDKLFPSSEWLVHGLIAGWPGIMLFTFIICLPFFMSVPSRFWWCLLHAVLAFSILFDTGLSTQFGIFIYGFFILMWWQYSVQVKAPLESGVS